MVNKTAITINGLMVGGKTIQLAGFSSHTLKTTPEKVRKLIIWRLTIKVYIYLRIIFSKTNNQLLKKSI
jgi:hypothetical protein